jgi:hypothetical protein
VHKFTFPVYSLLIIGLASELWFFEVHWQVHKYIGSVASLQSPIVGRWADNRENISESFSWDAKSRVSPIFARRA